MWALPANHAWRLALKCLGGAAALSVAAACGSSRSAPPASRSPSSASPTSLPAPRPKGFFTLTIQVSVRGNAGVACPSRTPGNAQCYVLIENGDSPQLGAVTVAPVLDVEFPTQPPCGTSHNFVEKLTLRSGSLAVRISAPYLCLGDINTTERRFVVESGTGKYVGYTGSGSIAFSTLASGAVETWEGILAHH